MYANLNFREKLRAMPLLRALMPMVAGIVCGTLITISLYLWVIAAVVCGMTAWLGRKQKTAKLYVGLTILFFGAALARAHMPESVVPQGERVWLEILMTGDPTYREGRRSASADGTVIRWQTDSSALSDNWRPTGEKLLVSIDTMWRFSAGDRVVFRGYVNPISDSAGSYSRLMKARGYTGRTYISQYSRPEIVATAVKIPNAWAKKLQVAATERLLRLRFATTNSMTASEMAVAVAMTTGDRSDITPGLRSAYSRTGAAHLLAVSGLHVGIVFLMVNVLLYLLPLVRRGHIVKNVVATVVIWLYAAVTGFSPSAMRAAIMFTGAQIALATSQTRGAANIMCGTALVMLAVRPGLLFDISFQLSFVAVAGILAWFTPLYRMVASRWRVLNAIWATLIVGLVASLATMPLVSYTFGVFSPAGIVLNPLIIFTAHLIIGFSLLWIVMPAQWLEPVFRWLVGGPAWLQNRIVELVGEVPGAAIEWRMPLWLVFTVYATMIIFTAWLAARPSHEAGSFVLPR